MKEKLFIIIIILSCNLFSQDKKYFDAPFGGGGGYTPGWIFVNLDELNKQLVGFGSGKCIQQDLDPSPARQDS